MVMVRKTINNNGHDYVDLGLPSGRLWATCNIGASVPTEYGDYFMWGSTKPNNGTKYKWKNTPFTNHSKNSSLRQLYFERYRNKFCPNNTLSLEYDIAHIAMGGDWRMPTKEELQELTDNTISKWVTDYQGSGINGAVFTSKTNNKSIFFPFTGFRWGYSFNGEGDLAYLWSSSLNGENPDYAWYLGLLSDAVYLGRDYRCYGFSVRGVL